MNRHNEEGIILRPVDFRERDRILTFLTREQGKISGIVHGARSLKS
ncbi:MAG: DNA repair protein RecO, partial [bacterium]